MSGFQKTIIQKHTLLILSCVIYLAGCEAQQNNNVLKEAWNSVNEPVNISGSGINILWKSLPLQGEVTQKGWSDDYWATYKGGISYRWQDDEIGYELISSEVTNSVFDLQSPAEKYDLFMNRFDFPTTLSERERTHVLKTQEGSAEYDSKFKIPTWEGLCHGWAPAAMNFKEPVKTVEYKLPQGNSVTFYPSDIKALLIYYHQYSGNRREILTQYVAERCQANFSELQEKLDSGKITEEQYKEMRNSIQCTDMNAGSFHLLLTNELGLNKKGFVVDVTRDAEVWNQPVNSFTSTVIEEKDGASEGAAPLTVKEVRISTKMRYSVEIAPSREQGGIREELKTYEYFIELNAAGEIIGGHWLSGDSDRPDFVWREAPPVFQGYFKRLKKLYEDSISG